MHVRLLSARLAAAVPVTYLVFDVMHIEELLMPAAEVSSDLLGIDARKAMALGRIGESRCKR
jgi:hypothetical protein